MNRSDEALALMQALATGERQALARLIALFGPGIRAFAAQELRNPAEAEDIAQEVFVRVWRHAGRYSPERGAVTTWIWQIALNLCRDRNRRGALRQFIGLDAVPDMAAPDPGADARLDSHRRLARTRAAIAQLPARQRHAILLRASAGMSTAEIAATMGTGPGAVEQLLVRARATLRARIDDPARIDAPKEDLT